MITKREHFQSATDAAAREREFSKTELAETLAAEFEADPSGFDPRRLISLGYGGLRHMIDCLDHPAAVPDEIIDEPEQTDESTDEPSGWSDMRRPEGWPQLYSLVIGIFAGFVILMIGGAARVVLVG